MFSLMMIPKIASIWHSDALCQLRVMCEDFGDSDIFFQFVSFFLFVVDEELFDVVDEGFCSVGGAASFRC